MAGCFLVDYSYVETEGLAPGYTRDPRVYDVNRDKSAGSVSPSAQSPAACASAHPVPGGLDGAVQRHRDQH
jgi:hypothetical protein